MGERKVLNKYYPPCFDPAKIPRRKNNSRKQLKVRTMLPMTIRCNTCGSFICKGTKFNSVKEDAVGETYIRIQIIRLYFKCTNCSSEIILKTDPQNSDYTVESGASRNHEPWQAEDEVTEREKRRRVEEDGDTLKALENKASKSKKDLDTVAALEELQSMKNRRETVSTESMHQILEPRNSGRVEVSVAEEAIIKEIFLHRSKGLLGRIHDGDDEDTEGVLTGSLTTTTILHSSKTGDDATLALKPKFNLKLRSSAKKPRFCLAEIESPKTETAETNPNNMNSGLKSLCTNYDSSESG